MDISAKLDRKCPNELNELGCRGSYARTGVLGWIDFWVYWSIVWNWVMVMSRYPLVVMPHTMLNAVLTNLACFLLLRLNLTWTIKTFVYHFLSV